jgi:hypothetical protein
VHSVMDDNAVSSFIGRKILSPRWMQIPRRKRMACRKRQARQSC